MTFVHGRILSVAVEELATAAVDDAVAGASVLAVDDVTDIDVGLQVAVEDHAVPYLVTDVDEDTETITLAPVLTAAVEGGDTVTVIDPRTGEAAVITVATVMTADGEGDAIEAVVAHHLAPYLAEGTRQQGEGEPVRMQIDGSEYLVVDAPGATVRPAVQVPISCAGPASEERGSPWPILDAGRYLTEVRVWARSGSGSINLYVDDDLRLVLPEGRTVSNLALAKGDLITVAMDAGGDLEDVTVLLTIT